MIHTGCHGCVVVMTCSSKSCQLASVAHKLILSSLVAMCIIELQSCNMAFSTDEILLGELEDPTLQLPTASERQKLELGACVTDMSMQEKLQRGGITSEHFVTDMSMQEPGILGTCFCQTALERAQTRMSKRANRSHMSLRLACKRLGLRSIRCMFREQWVAMLRARYELRRATRQRRAAAARAGWAKRRAPGWPRRQ